jgi:hypothetical protein
MSEKNIDTPWHAGQKKRVARCLDKIEKWPHPLRGLVGAKLISLTNAIESLNGPRPKHASNHDVVTKMLAELEDAIDRVEVTNA